MTKLVCAAVIVAGCVAACGGDDGGGVDPTGDGGIDGVSGPCNPLAPPFQQNCDPGERCTWVVLDTAAETGEISCVPEGTLPIGSACTPSSAGQPDRCAAGTICADGLCRDLCGFDGSAEAACPAGDSCARHQDQFASGDGVPTVGACTPSCDPLTQLRPDGAACPTGEGCYLLTGAAETVAVCAPVGTGGHGDELTGRAYANSCVPGAEPRRRNSASMTVECGGLCKPVDVTSTMARGSEGGLAPDSCMLRWGAASPDNGGLGESCRYWSAREPFAALSPFSNSVGWCFKHVSFLYDPAGTGTPDTSFPRCAGLTMGDVVPPIGNPPHNDALYFWCLAQSEPRGPVVSIPQVRADRLK